MPPLSFTEAIFAHLKQPEYVHVLLNPLPIYGLALGGLALGVAMLMRSRRAQITALLVILTGAAAVIPVRYFGDAGYDTVESQSSDEAAAWLDAHGQRAVRAMPAFYALIALVGAALLAPWKWPRTAVYLNAAVLALTIADFAISAWIGYAGGQAVHPEFRSGTPPEKPGGYDKMR